MKINRAGWRRQGWFLVLVFAVLGLLGAVALELAARHRPAGRGITNPQAPVTGQVLKELRQAGR